MEREALLDEAEKQLQNWAEVYRVQGLNSWQLLRMCLIMSEDLFNRADIEYHLKAG